MSYNPHIYKTISQIKKSRGVKFISVWVYLIGSKEGMKLKQGS